MMSLNWMRAKPGSRRHFQFFVLGCGLAMLTGCMGPQAGQWLYTLGVNKPPKTAAQFQLPKKPLLILVDDDRELAQPSTICDFLVDSLAKELRDHGLVDRVTTTEELARLRQNEPKFDRRGAREIGRMVNADTVLWLMVTRYALETNLEWAASPGSFGVSVKVIDATSEKRENVRLWPTNTEGKQVEVQLSVHEVRKAKNLREAQQKLADTLAIQVAKLFYEYQE